MITRQMECVKQEQIKIRKYCSYSKAKVSKDTIMQTGMGFDPYHLPTRYEKNLIWSVLEVWYYV